ncbi:MAG TPA: O-succinylhomoserine sulfhydrylase [Alphaproteobacteria bacterium]
MADGKEPSQKRGALRARTLAVRGGLRRSDMDETAEALFLTSGYVYDSAEEAEKCFLPGGSAGRFVYSRYGNPTVSMFEERLRLMEGAEACRATASGMAAVFAALMCQVRAGDRVVASRALFGSCHYICSELLPRYGVESIFVDGADLNQWKKALDRPTKAVFLETPSNPMLDIIDLRAVCELAHNVGARVVVDNVFATPLLQKPIQLGADVVVYSATKHIDGQGRTLGGAILGPRKFIEDELTNFLRHTGPSLSPFNAWVLVKGLETLDLRLAAQCKSARNLAVFLGSHPKVVRALYPELPSHPQAELARAQMSAGGTMVTFEVKGGKAGAFRALNSLALIDISNNLGDSKSLICHPATTTHQRVGPEERARLGISDGVLRLSVGLEDEADLRADLEQALASV